MNSEQREQNGLSFIGSHVKAYEDFMLNTKETKRALIYFGEEELMFNEWWVLIDTKNIEKLRACNDFFEALKPLGEVFHIDNNSIVEEFIDLSQISKPFLEDPIKWIAKNLEKLKAENLF
ncbi:MAG: hypothetical protein PHE67_00970 [Campylobacterales bacterium]|nr:hypothetical protein [Campylobacterales bacterium]